jgi:hypothetical protein
MSLESLVSEIDELAYCVNQHLSEIGKA